MAARTTIRLVTAALGFLLTILVAPPLLAATIPVSTTDDEINADGDCGLREAVRAANTNLAVDQCTAGSNTETDTIVVPAGVYTLTIADDFNDTALGNDLDIVDNTADDDLVIIGAGAAVTIIQACPVDQKTTACPAGQGVVDRVFQNLSARLAISGVTIRHGRSAGMGVGILNQTVAAPAVVTLTTCVVTANGGDFFGQGGIGNSDGSTVTVIDSTVSDNVGGGVSSRPSGVLTITGSTVSGNNPGGIVSQQGTVTITNSTISGNTSNGNGAGILVSGGTLALRSSTVTGNILTPMASGRGAGLFAGAAVTIRNSILAGNLDQRPGPAGRVPDCSTDSGTLTSEGHNIIGDNNRCQGLSDGSNGDQVGTQANPLDPLLGPLADHGGPTATHLLLSGSPALDAGNPAVPGSGGFACPTTDQRGEDRPDGVACDIGALELAGSTLEFAIDSLRPSRGGNAGSVLALVYGSGLVDGAVLKLTRAGEPDIVGSAAKAGANGTVLASSLDLRGAAPGLWNVTVTNLNSTTATLPEAFTIEAGGGPDLWVELGMPRVILFGRVTTFHLRFGNRGNVDAYGAPLWFSFPDELEFHIPFPVSPPPPQPGQIPTDWSRVAIDVPLEPPADRDTFPLLLPVVPAGFSGALRFRLKAPLTIDPARNPVSLTYDIGKPYFGPSLSPATIALFVARAKQHATEVHGAVAFPADAAIEQYVRTQLERVVEQGTAEAVARVGGTSPVYSLTQLLIDTGQFIAGEIEPLAALDKMPTHMGWLAHLVANAWLGASDAQARYVVDDDCDPTDVTCERFSDCDEKPPTGPCAPDPPAKQCDKQQLVDDAYVFVPCRPQERQPKPGLGNSFDPNDKVGPNGPGGFVDGLAPIPYTVFFENLATATAAALEVVITDQLDTAKLALETFSFGPITLGLREVSPPPGLTSFTTDVDFRPAQDLLVRIEADLDAGSGIATWKFTALDPATGELPEDPTNGFLPPNVTAPEGEGSVLFTISPKPGLALGSSICNDARIVFDFNAPIDTPEWCNTIGQPENCENCVDDDGDQLTDRADDDCTPPANGAGAGLSDPGAAKALDKCAKAVRKVGSKLTATTLKQLGACQKAVADCVQLKPGDASCLTKAEAKCTKARTALANAETTLTAGIAKACAEPSLAAADLLSAVGLGFGGETRGCGERGVASLATIADVAACVRRQHACAAERVLGAAVPRARELLLLGGWDPGTSLACLEEGANGAGSAIAAPKRKALRKCDRTIQKAAAKLLMGRTKAGQSCSAAVFTCFQTKAADPSCVIKARGACQKALATLPKLGSTLASSIAKSCGAAPLAAADLLTADGIGAAAHAETCQALGIVSLASITDVTTCLTRQLACRADQLVESETPRLRELLGAAGATLP